MVDTKLYACCTEVLQDLAHDLVKGQYADKERAVAMLSGMTMYIDHHDLLLECGVLPALMTLISTSKVEPTVSCPMPYKFASGLWSMLCHFMHVRGNYIQHRHSVSCYLHVHGLPFSVGCCICSQASVVLLIAANAAPSELGTCIKRHLLHAPQT